jgi:shikimate kinase
MNVVLIGYRGSGKSVVGRLLAERLGRAFADSDEYIEEQTKLSIAEIFRTCGESYFRELESQALESLSKRDGIVLATGGGAVLRYKNIQLLQRGGKVIFLRVSPEEAFKRLVKDPKSSRTRPKLTDLELMEEIRQHLAIRTPYYESAAHFSVNVDAHDAEGVVRQIVHFLAEA